MASFLRAIAAAVRSWFRSLGGRWTRLEAARVAAEAEAQRKAEEDERARLAAEAEARRQAEEAARVAAEAEARRKAEEDERARLAAEAEARRQAEEAARVAAEAEARRKAEEDERARLPAEAEAAQPGTQEADAENAAPPSPAGPDAQPEGEQWVPGGESTGRRGATEGGTSRTRPPRYRPPAGAAPAPRQTPAAATPAAAERGRGNTRPGANYPLPIELRLLFERSGSCRITLLPRRTSGLPEELTLRTTNGVVDLSALQDDWYQDVAPENLGALLRDGVVWRSEDTGQEWLLSGRDVFVLAPGTAHSGLVSCARLAIGREHAVLATVLRLPEVEAALREAGCERWSRLDENDGAPRGWVVLRSVKPQATVPWTDTADILNVLRPLPQVEIALEGGICLGYASWLASHPPAIRVYGDSDHTRDVRIDGHAATAEDDGRFTAPGWDTLGTHEVWCNGTTRTYALVHTGLPSKVWPAFSFPAPGHRGTERLAICGPLVRVCTNPDPENEDAATSEVCQLPATNPVLLGSHPGEVFVMCPRPEIRSAHCIASTPFAPVWALPAQPLLCTKKENRVRLVGPLAEPSQRSCSHGELPTPSDVAHWCRLIRDASRKGLTVDPATEDATELWTRYKKYARDLWRRKRR